MIIRQSLWRHAWSIILICLLIIAPFFLMYYLWQKNWWGIVIFILLLAIALWLLWRTYWIYFHTIFVVTSHRMIDLTQLGFFRQEINFISYQKIRDIYCQIHGIFNTIFKIGAIEINMIDNKNSKIILPSVRNPRFISSELARWQKKFMAAQDRESVAERLIRKIRRKLGAEAFERLIRD